MPPDQRPLHVESLLADAGWVRALACRLVRDPAEADDLAQDALVAAWRRPPEHGTPPRAWLAQVLHNLLRQRRRSAGAREARERRTARRVDETADLVERAELAHKLAEHVLRLEEPYRSTVLQRFFAGWSAEEIARRTGANPSSVRTRLERALATLRQRLERENGREWLGALLPLARVETLALKNGAIAGMTGGIVMSTACKLGLAAVGLACLGWWLWPCAAPLEPLRAEETALVAVGPALETTPALEEPAQVATRSATPAAPPRAPTSEPAPALPLEPGTIAGLVVRLAGGDEAPIEGASVLLWPAGEEADDERVTEGPPRASARSQADGSFRFTKLAPGSYVLGARHERGPLRQTRGQVAEGSTGDLVRIVFGGTRIHGRIHDEQGQPLAGVPIRIEGGHEFRFALRGTVTSDEQGDYAIEELPAGRYFGLVTRDGQTIWPGRMWYLTLVDGDDLRLDLGAREPLPHWRGSVRSAGGETVRSGGTLHLEHVQQTRLGSEAKTYREVHFDATARFDVALEPERWHPAVSLESKPDTRRTFDAVEIVREGLERDLVLPGTRLSGTVIDSVTLKPLSGYAGVLKVSVSRPGRKHPSAFQSVYIDENGRFAIDMLEPGAWELTTFPLKVAAVGAKLQMSIAPGASEVALDIDVQKP